MKKQHLVWQTESQPPETALHQAQEKLQETSQEAWGYTNLLRSEACQCPHLGKWFPEMLDLAFIRPTSGPRAQPLLLKDPIHALHLSSQLEDNSTLFEHNYRNIGTSPWIYGEEQQRTVALSQAGIPESFFPLTKEHLFHEFNTVNPDAPKPLHSDTIVTKSEDANLETKPAAATITTTTTTTIETSPSNENITTDGTQPTGTTSSQVQVGNEKPIVTTSGTVASPADDRTKDTEDQKQEQKQEDKNEKKPEEIKSDPEASKGGDAASTPSVTFAASTVIQKPEEEKPETNTMAAEKKKQKDIVEQSESMKTADNPRNEGNMPDTENKAEVKDDESKTENKDANVHQKDNDMPEVAEGTKNDKNHVEEGSNDVEMRDSNQTDNNEVSTSIQSEEEEGTRSIGNVEKATNKGDSQKEKKGNATLSGNTEESKDVEMKEVDDKAENEEMKEAAEEEEIKEKADVAKVGPKEDEKNSREETTGPSKNAESSKISDSVGDTSEMEVKGKKDESTRKNLSEDEDVGKATEQSDEMKEEAKQIGESSPQMKANESGKIIPANTEDNPYFMKKADDAEIANKPAKKEEMKPDGTKADLKKEAYRTVGAEESRRLKNDVPEKVSSNTFPSESRNETAAVSSSAISAPSSTGDQDGSATSPNTATTANRSPSQIPPTPKYLLSEPRYTEISRQEDQVRVVRNLLSKRVSNTKKKSKKRQSDSQYNSSASSALQNLPGSLQYTNERAITDMTAGCREEWLQTKATACRKVEALLEQFRSCRRSYWEEERLVQQRNTKKQKKSSFLSTWAASSTIRRTCQMCKDPRATGDEILQCMECSFVGCGPASVCRRSESHHILQHLFLTGHKFAVTCGARAEIFCFSCGDFVYNKVFDQERERLDMEERIPWLAWNDHALRRSFDPLQFVRVEEYGVVWRGLVATYPPLVPQEHVDAARYCLQRQAVFEGHLLQSNWPLMGRRALDFLVQQHKEAPSERWRIPMPVGMYNLGNTCFMSSIVQCMINCAPLQRYFLKEIGHNHKSCETYRYLKAKEKNASLPAGGICLACEMDSLFLDYYSRSNGRDVVGILDNLSNANISAADAFMEISRRDEETMLRGEPIIIDKMLHAAWRSSGMNHLAGYEQRDAHEFLHAFLDILGKQICQHRARVDAAINLARVGSPFAKQPEQVHHDIIKHLFEGSLRSVLICQDCGSKRMLSEAFMNVSLPLSKEVTISNVVDSGADGKLSLDRCLEHFTAPEKLADPVDCPACRKKTPTKKQHTFSRLPRVLCVHLKRFHAALNKKIDDFVSFPAYGLNMGPLLPHWREITTVPGSRMEPLKGSASAVAPEVLYDLFGTVNHRGGLQSGHYITNLKVEDRWFRINDQHVSTSNEAEVLKSEAYLLFYSRRS